MRKKVIEALELKELQLQEVMKLYDEYNNGSTKYSIKGDSKLLIRNLRKMSEQKEQTQALDLSNVSHRLILALDDYGRKVGRDSYGLPIDPDTKNFDTKHGKEMIEIVEGILCTIFCVVLSADY